VTVLVGVAWIALTAAGQAWGWSERARALVDLFALAGFGFALYLTWQVWRLRRADKGSQ
jgi:type VI protein secretion system component VasK